MTVTITPLGPPLGAEATSVDLAGTVSDDDAEALRTALREHLVLIIRGQKLDPGQYVNGMKIFGEPIEQNEKNLVVPGHPEITQLDSRTAVSTQEDGRKMPIGSRDWHTDHTNRRKPPKMTALLAIQLPSSGGDTGFANMQSAYEGLDAAEREKLDAMKTVNALLRKNDYTDEETLQQSQKDAQTHPFIRTHPETGKRAIYVHPAKLAHFEGWTPEASKEYLYDLLDRVITPDVIYRHKWQDGDLVIWDNRALMHLAYTDYDLSEGRIMQRMCLAGDVPA